MEKRALGRLAWKHALNSLSEELYRSTGIDRTKPVAFYAVFNERCNVKCQYCGYWRQDDYKEMSVDEWRKGLLSIRDFVGAFSISFSGGEPFLKPGLTDLLGWCRDQGISAGVTTNGSALTARNAAKLVAARPFNVNISVDGPTAELHDHLRGSPGLFQRLSAGIGFLLEERRKQGIQFPIIIKPTVTSKNFRALPDLVRWTEEVGASSLSLQPVDRWTPETYTDLWIEEPDMADLERVVEELVGMAQAGSPILTPVNLLRLLPDHFRGKSAPADALPCRVGTRNFFIRATGDVELCHVAFPVIGNLRTQTAEEIWTGSLGRQVRRETYECERLCLITCLSQKTLGDKMKMAVSLLRSQSARGEPAPLEMPSA